MDNSSLTPTPFDRERHILHFRNEARITYGGAMSEESFQTWLGGELHTTREQLRIARIQIVNADERISTLEGGRGRELAGSAA